jgi:hypothetical protein
MNDPGPSKIPDVTDVPLEDLAAPGALATFASSI